MINLITQMCIESELDDWDEYQIGWGLVAELRGALGLCSDIVHRSMASDT